MALDQIEDVPQGEKEMSFFDHLEELRWHLIRSLVAILVFSIVAFFMKDFIYGVLILGPAKPNFWTYKMMCKLAFAVGEPSLCVDKLNFTLQSRTMTGQFMMHISSSFVIGLICAFPIIVWELWRFIKPGLYLKEQSATTGAVFYVTLLFALGVLFGYYIISPLSIQFLANYQLDPTILNQFDITSYISTLIMMVLASGLMFQLPVVVFILTKMGVLTPSFMRSYRKHAFVIILIIAAIITPSPDMVSQLLVAIPVYFLFEISIFISAFELKKQMQKSEI